MKLKNVLRHTFPHHRDAPHTRLNAFERHLRLNPSVYLQKIAAWINSHPRTYYLLVLIVSIGQILLEV